MKPRIGLIGARRARQGLGPFVARDLIDAGAEVPAVLGTTLKSVDEAVAGLRGLGVEAHGYTELDHMLERERLDALAILSPAETHESYLKWALAAGLPVLCEKPFVWGRPGLAKRSADLAAGFAAAGLLLRENCQWPYVLPAFERLHGGVLEQPLERFEMWLAPASQGLQALGDALPHPLSVLQHLAPTPDARVEAPEFGRESPDGLEIRFTYRAGGRATAVAVHLERSEVTPRPAALSINGHLAKRLVRMPDYSMFFAAGTRVVDVEDPLRLLLVRFVEDLASARSRAGGPGIGETSELIQRMELLETLVTAFEGDT